jgi:hypothetical protein
MKLLIFSITCMIFAGCASSPEVSPEVRQYCTKVCQDQDMKFYGAGEDNKCVCSERPERFILERHSNNRD